MLAEEQGMDVAATGPKAEHLRKEGSANTLTKKASLNAIAKALDFSAQLIVGSVVRVWAEYPLLLPQ